MYEMIMEVLTRLEDELEEDYSFENEREDEKMFKALFELLEDI